LTESWLHVRTDDYWEVAMSRKRRRPGGREKSYWLHRAIHESEGSRGKRQIRHPFKGGEKMTEMRVETRT